MKGSRDAARELATVCGVVERVNKLVSVRPLRARYSQGVVGCYFSCGKVSACFAILVMVSEAPCVSDIMQRLGTWLLVVLRR